MIKYLLTILLVSKMCFAYSEIYDSLWVSKYRIVEQDSHGYIYKHYESDGKFLDFFKNGKLILVGNNTKQGTWNRDSTNININIETKGDIKLLIERDTLKLIEKIENTTYTQIFEKVKKTNENYEFDLIKKYWAISQKEAPMFSLFFKNSKKAQIIDPKRVIDAEWEKIVYNGKVILKIINLDYDAIRYIFLDDKCYVSYSLDGSCGDIPSIKQIAFEKVTKNNLNLKQKLLGQWKKKNKSHDILLLFTDSTFIYEVINKKIQIDSDHNKRIVGSWNINNTGQILTLKYLLEDQKCIRIVKVNSVKANTLNLNYNITEIGTDYTFHGDKDIEFIKE